MELAAHCSGLVKRYAETTAVDGLDLEVRRGECFGLLGPNGAGKTTTVEIFEGLTTPDAGKVEVLGMLWGGRFDHEIRQRIGVQLQESQLGDKLTVTEVLTLFSSLYDRSRPLEQLIEWFELGPKADTRFHQLSGGQKQRVSLACALVSDPDLLFLDEPTTGLDPQARRKVWDVISDYRKRGGTVVLTSHYMEECEKLCDRIAIMDHGKRIALGTPDELIAALDAKQLVEFRLEQHGARTDANGAAQTFDAASAGSNAKAEIVAPSSVLDAFQSEGIAQRHGWWTFGTSDVSSALPRLLELLKREGAELTALRTREPTLEDVFLELTGRTLRDD